MCLIIGAGVCIFRCCLARWPIGGGWIGQWRGSVLGRKVWDRPIDVKRSQASRSVIPEADPSTLD